MSRFRVEALGPVVVVLLLFAACGGGTSPHAIAVATFYHSCERADDCTAVYEGELDCCGLTSACPNAALRSQAAPAYENAARSRMPMCDGPTLCVPNACQSALLTCPAGVCELHLVSEDTPAAAAKRSVSLSEYGTECQDVADCVAVYVGPLGCCGLGCPNAAIRQDDLARYMSDLDRRVPFCYPTPPCVPSDQCRGDRVACENGVCKLLSGAPGAPTGGPPP